MKIEHDVTWLHFKRVLTSNWAVVVAVGGGVGGVVVAVVAVVAVVGVVAVDDVNVRNSEFPLRNFLRLIP